MIIDNRYYRIISIFGYRLRALVNTTHMKVPPRYVNATPVKVGFVDADVDMA